MKTLGAFAGLAIDPPVRGARRMGQSPDLDGVTLVSARSWVSVMTENLGAHVNRLEYGFLLPMIVPEDMEALKARYCK